MTAEQKALTESAQESAIRDDEIDLFDLWDDIVEEKIWVFLGFIACVALAGVYLFMATPIYQTQVVVKPASDNSVVELNAPQFTYYISAHKNAPQSLQVIYSKTVDEAFVDARSALLSKEYRRTFFEAYLDEIKSIEGVYNPQLSQAQNFSRFDALFSSKVSSEKKDVETYVQISFELSDPQKAAELLNAYVDFALNSKLGDIKDTLENKVAAHIGKLEYDASQLREKYKGEQTRRALMVNEAYEIAKAVGQVDPVFSKSEIVGTYEPPLYMFGTKALKAEEKAIKSREDLAKALPYGEDHFIDQLPELLFKIEQLQALEIDYSKVNLAVVDEKAIIPISPIKPKKLLVIALSVVAGVFAGLMLALLMAAFHRHKEKIKSKIRARRWA